MIFFQTRFPPTLSEWSKFVQCETHGTVHRSDERCLECRVDDLEKNLRVLMSYDQSIAQQDLEGGE